MPLCGTKKSKKQKRDPSPPFAPAGDIIKEKEKAEKRVGDLQGLNEDLQEELGEVKRSRDRLREEVESLKKSLEEKKNDVVDAKVPESGVEDETKLQQIQLELTTEKKQREAADEVKRKLEDEIKQAHKHLETERNHRLKVEEEKNRFKKEKEDTETELRLTKQQLDNAFQEKSQKSPTREPSFEWKTKIQTAESELQKERDQRMEKEREISRIASEKTQLQNEFDDLRKQTEELKSCKDKQDGVILDLQKNMEIKENNFRNEADKMMESLKKETEEKDKLLSRLSNVMANQVLDGNPNLTDLSDPNRPMKLGEGLSQLYDDQWTDASEQLEKQGKTELEIPKLLLNLLTTTYKHCKDAAENQLARIEENIFLPPLESDTTATTTPHSPTATNGQEAKSPTSSKSLSASRIPRYSSKSSRPAIGSLSIDKKEGEGNGQTKERKPKRNLTFPRQGKGDKSIEIPVELKKGVKDFRKTVSKQVIPVIEKEVLNKLRGQNEFGEAVVGACEPYIKKAVELCWLMRIQDPPVHLSWSVPNDETLDTDLYRHYTKTGCHVDYVVWPIMYLHEGGPILVKGVAQGKE